MTLDIKALAIASAAVAAAGMLALGVLGNLGLAEGAVDTMQQWHVAFDLSAVGIMAGMAEAALASAALVSAWGWLYNRISEGST